MYSHLFVAGTFDRLHAGHRFLLTRAFEEGERVTIGLTSDAFVKNYKLKTQNSKLFPPILHFPFSIFHFRSYAQRRRELLAWIKRQSLLARATIIPIADPYEPAASMADLDGIIVTVENRKRGEEINALRQRSALSPLVAIEVEVVEAVDGKPISSTRLRNGEIDPDGRLVMPESLRSILGEPLGKILRGRAIAKSFALHKKDLLITVGDMATKTLLDAGITPTLAIIDGKVGRKPYLDCYNAIIKATPYKWRQIKLKSGPGFISREAVEAIKECFPHHPIHPFTHHAIIIDGEEDLLVIPAIIHAPLRAGVYYGQPDEGLVEVIVTKEKKYTVGKLLMRFLKSSAS